MIVILTSSTVSDPIVVQYNAGAVDEPTLGKKHDYIYHNNIILRFILVYDIIPNLAAGREISKRKLQACLMIMYSLVVAVNCAELWTKSS